ncbi:MAG: hypothetical protein UIH27_14310 [Ruminococcus sp.]|nr:hypothetical protein [Ruminococcus sp.]
MAKIIDITDKLNFEEKPIVKIKDTELTVNNDAMDILKVTAIFEEENIRSSDILAMFELLFDEENREKLKALRLSMKDFASVIMNTARAAINNYEDEPQGEAPTPATT